VYSVTTYKKIVSSDRYNSARPQKIEGKDDYKRVKKKTGYTRSAVVLMSTVFEEEEEEKKKRNHVEEKLHGTTFILISKKKLSYLGSDVLSRCRRNGAVQLAFFSF
jgi:hypothetical protein